MNKIAKIVKTLSYILLVTVLYNVQAAQLPSNISPQQLAMFKKLPPAQQQSLAQSMGIDIRAIQAQLNNADNQTTTTPEQPQLQQYYPRGTQFDQFGQPITSDQAIAASPLDAMADELKPFGYDVFANAPLSFMAPANDIVAPSDYIIGANDALTLQIYGKENISYELSVSAEGQLIIPQLGPFTVAGMTLAEVKHYLTHEITNKILGVDVVITLSKLRSLRVFVLGEAYKPGPYLLSSMSSITHALFAAGGINDIGSLRNIQLKRAGKLITTLDLYDLLIAGDSSNDLMLQSGDVIFVAPVGDQVSIEGQVKRPAIYELAGNETYRSILDMAGGFLPSAFPASTVVERFTKDNLRTVRTVDLSQKQVLSSKVKAGDAIEVMQTSNAFADSVMLIGAVTRPGMYQWKQAQRLSDLMTNAHTDLLSDADLSYGLIVREKDQARNIEILQFDLAAVFSGRSTEDNIELKAHDKIIVFSLNQSKQQQVEQLDNLAFTRDELFDAEKKYALENYANRQFWLEYGDKGKSSLADPLVDANDKVMTSLDQYTESQPQHFAIEQLNSYSRQRLLLPIIERLKQQAAAGQPLQLIEVDGSVKYPGIYPLAVNAKVDDLLKAAGGLLESAYLQRAEITRDVLVNNVLTKDSIQVNLAEALSNEDSNNIALQSKDHLMVLQIPAWQENHIVELRGEFVFPGKYTIRRGETLGELIARVGGYTEFAYAQASVFTRVKLKQLEQQNIIKVADNLRAEIASKSLAQNNNQTIDYSQAKLLLADLTKIKPVGRLVVDLPAITAGNGGDVLLENGDVLYVPAQQNSVNVIGQVQVATSHIFASGLSASDYISLSGGIKKQADDERVYVIKANGAVEIPEQGNWFASSAKQYIAPGDTVVVPLDSDYMNNLTLWSTGTQIIYQAAVAIAAISGI